MKKTWLIGCGALAVAACAGLALVVDGVFALTRPVVEASEQFLALLGEGKVAEAYASTAAGFRDRQDGESFAVAVEQLGLTGYASVSWHSRQIVNQEGLAEGTVTTRSGGTRPIVVQLVRKDGRWAVAGVRYGGADLATTKVQLRVPPDADLERMAADALLAFNRSVRARDFTAFYGALADVWKRQTTPERLRQTFQEFIDKDIDIAGIRDVKPRIAPTAAVTDGSKLVVAGHYPTKPSQVRFELEYAYEGRDWKLRGISVGVGNAGAE